MESSRWQDIYRHLKSKGVKVYSPSTKEGECTFPYVVVKNDGLTAHTSFSTNIQYYTLLCYVPRTQYSQLEVYVNSIKEYMKELKPMIKEAGMETSSFYDDDFKAHMVSVQYQNYKKA